MYRLYTIGGVSCLTHQTSWSWQDYEFIIMNDTQQEKAELALELKTRERWLVGVESTVYIVVLLTSLLGNIMLTVAVYKTRTLRRSENYYLVSLAATDILNAVVCMPLTLAAIIQGTWPFGDFICQLQGSVISICATLSILTLGMIAINRYVKIVKSASLYQKIFSKKNVYISIAVSWIFVVFITSLIYCFRTTVFVFHPGKVVCWIEVSPTEALGLYCACWYALNVSLSYLAIFCSYYKVFKKIRAHFVQVAGSSLHNNTSTAFNEEVRITMMLFVTVVAFMICWTPTNVVDFYEIVGGYYKFPRQVYYLTIFTFSSSSAINPLIYGLMKKEFKEAYKNVLWCKKEEF